MSLPTTAYRAPIADLSGLLTDAVARGASDIHIRAGRPVLIRVDGDLISVTDGPVSSDVAEDLVRAALGTELSAAGIDADFAVNLAGVGRFRGNAFTSLGGWGLVLRHVRDTIPTPEELHLPDAVRGWTSASHGLIVVSGPTGSGKSTTLAALVGQINATRPCHILTIEDPVEFVHQDRRASLTQREIGTDTQSFERALRSGLRQDPDVIVIGEIRDLATMRIAAQAAETGHLVLASVHAGSALESVHRMVSLFDISEQDMARAALAESLVGVVSQRLVSAQSSRRRTLLTEVMVRTPRISEAITQPDRCDPLEEIIAAGEYYGMHTLLQDAVRLVLSGDLSVQDASRVVAHPAELDVALHRNGFRSGLQSTAGVAHV